MAVISVYGDKAWGSLGVVSEPNPLASCLKNKVEVILALRAPCCMFWGKLTLSAILGCFDILPFRHLLYRVKWSMGDEGPRSSLSLIWLRGRSLGIILTCPLVCPQR